jgi:hypothetical protein
VVVDSYEVAQAKSRLAGTVFQPRSPITNEELFSGRWSELITISDAVYEPGVHIVLYGERGVGKTSLSNVVSSTVRVMDRQRGSQDRLVIRTVAESGDTFQSIWGKLFAEITWQDNKPSIGLLPAAKPPLPFREAMGLQGNLTVDLVRRALSVLPGSLFIVDEFDRTARDASKQFTDLMKALSDLAVNSTIMLVGVAETVGKLVSDHASINRSLIQIRLDRMSQGDLLKILTTAQQKLEMKFNEDAASMIVKISQGLPHYTHLIGLHAVRNALLEQYSNVVQRDTVFSALKLAVKQAEQTTTEKYSKATHSAHKDALYRYVLLASAVAAAQSRDPLGFFNPAAVIAPLTRILNRPVQVATFNNHLGEFAQSDVRGHILERDGVSRGFRYRFKDPIVVPFIFMNASATGLASDEMITQLLYESS